MRALSCAHNRSHRLGKRRSSLRNSTVLARIAGSWQSGACYVQRAENPRALAFFPSPPPLPLSSPPFFIIICDPPLFSFSLSLSLSLSKPIPFAFFGRSSRKQNEAPPRSRFHTSSLLSPYLFLARKSSRHLHNTLGDVLFFLTIFVHIHSSHFRRVDTLFLFSFSFFFSLSSFFFFF